MKRENLYDVVEGACFGYYDGTFDECLNCKLSRQCKRAAESDEAEDVRRIPKTDTEVVSRLAERYSK